MTTFGVLGPLRVVGDTGDEVLLGGPLQRRLLAALVLTRGRTVTTDRLGELVWPDDAPLDNAALQSLVFRLRRSVEGLDLQYRNGGYVLTIGADSVDSDRFERLVLDAAAGRADDPVGALGRLDEALALWRGDPYEELVESDDARIETTRLAEVRARAIEERFDILIAAGRAVELLADLEAHVAREPLRERPRLALIDAYETSGRHVDALRVFDAYRRLLAAEIGVSPSPELQRRHAELLAADDATAGWTTSRRAAPTGTTVRTQIRPKLRRPTSSFVGRDELLASTVQALTTARLTTLIGPGGVGKTRLALEVADRLDQDVTGPVLFCDLSTATGDTVIDVVISAAGVERRADQTDLDRIVDVLRNEPWVVILDNCEHVIEVAATVAERLVETTERVIVLATSRERLAVDGERLIHVLPLDHDVDDATNPARRLLVDRVQAVTGHAPEPAERAALAQLAQRLDGLPLAIELAAARLQSLTVQEVIDGLDQSVAVLRGGRRTVERHRSVDAALRWSYDMLDPSERLVLRGAAAFAAPFRAVDVAEVVGMDRAATVEMLSRLIERSMVHRDGDFLHLLHVVRRFADDQSDADERVRFARNVASRMIAVAAMLNTDLRRSISDDAIREYIRRVPDFRRAIESALAHGDADSPLRMLGSLRDLALNSWGFELPRWAEQAAAAGAACDHPLTVDGYAIAAIGEWKRGDLGEMRRLLAAAEEVVARGGLGPTYELLGTLATEDLAHGDLERAIGRLRQALALPGVLDDHVRRAETFGTLVLCMSYSHHPQVIDIADEMAASLANTPSALAAAWCSYASGECRLHSDEVLARDHLERAVTVARAGGTAFVEGIAGASLASLDVRAGNVGAAIATYRWLIPHWLRSGLQTPFWTGLRAVAELLAGTEETTGAIRLLAAVVTPGSGHDVFGDDGERLERLRQALVQRVGSDTFDVEFALGTGLDEASAAQVATDAFDRVES